MSLVACGVTAGY